MGLVTFDVGELAGVEEVFLFRHKSLHGVQLVNRLFDGALDGLDPAAFARVVVDGRFFAFVGWVGGWVGGWSQVLEGKKTAGRVC